MTTYNGILARIHEATNTTTQVGLAQSFNIVQSTVAYWLKKKSIPIWFLDILFENKQINPFWILTGDGEKHTENYPSNDLIKKYVENNNLPIVFSSHRKNNTSFTLEVAPVKHTLTVNETAQWIPPLVNGSENMPEMQVPHHASGQSLVVDVPVYSSKFTGLTNSKGNVFQLERVMPMLSMYMKDAYKFFVFKSNCMEPAILVNSIIVINSEVLEFISGKIYAFSMPNQELTLAYVDMPMYENRNKAQHVNLIFQNKAFPNLQFPYEYAKKYLVGKLEALYHHFE